MRGFAVVANESVVFDTDGRKAIFRVCATVGTGGIAGLTGEGFYGLFGVGWHGCVVIDSDRAGATSSSRSKKYQQ
jgi:hypothetical protein